ncbi:DNA repair protein rad18 [Polyplosphaeria fusca]|uniref:Postreplication repair E3 ubiquitin-protein ligase RAD18 n=1 Tax=Polyplosphaeria fusca TaxID=682080 RepID=A0A9P4R6K5_9PLEO|nr:DNA repair protein rad18 [Polyplosphaeria fusca]
MNSFDVPDSTDWSRTALPLFEPLEASLRCEVCKEFYVNPVITTSCSHTFCSICIRRCLSTDGRCPACKTNVSTHQLLPNIAVRDLVKHFEEARPKALDLARREHNADQPNNKRKLDESDIEQNDLGSRTRLRRTRTRIIADGLQRDPIEVPDSEGEDDGAYVPDHLPEGVVRCPICQTPMKEEQVFSHLEDCPSEVSQSAGNGRQTRSTTNNASSRSTQRRQNEPSPTPTRLPQLNYHLLKDVALKKKLQELGIPTWGKSQLLIRRHTEWLHLWNSNCDSENPRPKKQLLQDLENWERTSGGRAASTESKIMQKDFNGQMHASVHKDQFSALIESARKKREAVEQDQTQGEAHSTTGEDSAEQQSELQSKPYEGNNEALATIREKVAAVNRSGSTLASLEAGATSPTTLARTATSSHLNPFGSPSKIVPMFEMPAEPVVDAESSTTFQ